MKQNHPNLECKTYLLSCMFDVHCGHSLTPYCTPKVHKCSAKNMYSCQTIFTENLLISCFWWTAFVVLSTVIHLSFVPENIDWRHGGVQNLPRHQGGPDQQACGVLVHRNLRHDVHLGGLASATTISLQLSSPLRKLFKFQCCHIQVQFGHAGACANQASETAVAKNQALRDAGAYVPKSFDELGDVIRWDGQHSVNFYPPTTAGFVFFFFYPILMGCVRVSPTGRSMMSWCQTAPSSRPRRCLLPQCRWITPGLG